MFPFEFTVLGPPRSQQSHDRLKLDAWRDQVRSAAAARWDRLAASSEALRIVVTYYHEGLSARIDGDNMLKPIQDALEGLVYNNDRQITETTCRKTPISQPVEARGAPMVLLEAFSRGEPFLYIKIDRATAQTDIVQ